MQQSTSSTSTPVPERSPDIPRRRRYLLYFLLAGFDVFAISISLYLNHRIMNIYVRSVAENQGWAEVLRDVCIWVH
jgi:hypothetical protein